MNSYKEFDKISIGASDIASLIVVMPRERGNLELASMLHFGGDGDYRAYYCRGDDVTIGEHYKLVATGHEWLKIYDDTGLSLDVRPSGEYRAVDIYRVVDIYRAGGMGCIIHWRNPRSSEEAARYGYDYTVSAEMQEGER